jgi:hypothetical protein
MNRLYLVGIAAGLVIGLAGCRHTCCTDRARYPDCDRCDPAPYSVAPRAVRSAPCGGVVSSASAAPREVIGMPTSAAPGEYLPGTFGLPPGFGSTPFAPVVPAPPNELPPPMETIPAPGVPTAKGITPPAGAIPPLPQPVALPK